VLSPEPRRGSKTPPLSAHRPDLSVTPVAMVKLGVCTQLAFEVVPYALVAITVFSSAFGKPLLAQVTALVLFLAFLNAVVGECDPWVRFLGDAPRNAYRGKVVWITGASQGLGEELALHCASLGARLILSSRREDVLWKVCAACDAVGAEQSKAVVLDARGGAVAAQDATRAALAIAETMTGDEHDHGGIDYLFLVAGGSQSSAAVDTAEEVDRDMFEINTLSAIALTKAVLPSMLRRRTGTICAIGSAAVKCPAPGQATYAATKAALAGTYWHLRATAYSTSSMFAHTVHPYSRLETDLFLSQSQRFATP
jgi:dehydrogenase/reductase SDR family protein 7